MKKLLLMILAVFAMGGGAGKGYDKKVSGSIRPDSFVFQIGDTIR